MNTTDKAQELQALRDRYVPKGHPNSTPFFVESAKGALLRDVNGREFIDFVGGIGVLNVGHCHPKVVAAVKDQAGRYLHTCSMVSRVVKVLEAMMKSVVSGETRRNVSARCVPSTLETKWGVMPGTA